MPIPPEIQGRKYISLTTFRKTGQAVPTPVWFGEDDGKLYVMSRSDSGKSKRVRNNPQVRVAPCTMRGKVTDRNSRPRLASCRAKTSRALATPSGENIGWRGYRFYGARRIFISKSRWDRSLMG